MNVDRYLRPIATSDPGRHAAQFDGLPHSIGALAEIAQGLLKPSWSISMFSGRGVRTSC
jgi:hypothetical protein